LEKNIPDLCADRVDYAFREFSLSVSKRLLKALAVKENGIVFKNEARALEFCQKFSKETNGALGRIRSGGALFHFGKILKKALKFKIISIQDFLKDDAYIINKLIKSKDKETLEILKILKQQSLVNLPKGEKIVYKKFRFVDPLFLDNGSLKRLSQS